MLLLIVWATRKIDEAHKLVDHNNPSATSWRIPIEYIEDAKGAARPRPLDEYHAQAIASMMYMSPHTGSGSPALVVVKDNQEDPTTTSPDQFVWKDMANGRYRYDPRNCDRIHGVLHADLFQLTLSLLFYRFVCFGHQHLLEAKRRCVKADEAKYANHEDRTEEFTYIECRLFMNLNDVLMNEVSLRAHASFLIRCFSGFLTVGQLLSYSHDPCNSFGCARSLGMSRTTLTPT